MAARPSRSLQVSVGNRKEKKRQSERACSVSHCRTHIILRLCFAPHSALLLLSGNGNERDDTAEKLGCGV